MRPILALIIICFSFFACKKNDADNGRRMWGTISAIKNGEMWEGEIKALSNSYSYKAGGGLDIFIRTYSDKDYHRETLHFFKILDEIDKYLLAETSILDKDGLAGADYFTSVDGGDVLGDLYDLILGDSIVDYVEITEISGKEIKGTFEMSFVKDLSVGEGDPSSPDTIIFTNGVFHTKILD